MENTTMPDECLQDCQRQRAVDYNGKLSSVLLPVTIFVGAEAVLGFLGNLVVIYIYYFRYHFCNFRYFVICLATIDLISCLTTMPGETLTQSYWYIYQWPIICKTKSFFNVFTVEASAFLLLAMATDRFLKICRPHKKQIKPAVALGLCFLALGLAGIFSIPFAFLWGMRSYQKTIDGVNVTLTLCEKDHNYEKTNKPLAFTLSLQVVTSIIMVVLAVFYVLIGRKLLINHRNDGQVVKHSVRSSDVSVNQTSHSVDSFSDIEKRRQPQPPAAAAVEEAVAEAIPTRRTERPNSNPDPKSTATTDAKGTGLKDHALEARVRRKTLILFIVTAVFIVTTILYLTLLSIIARSDDVLDKMSGVAKATYFFFFRLYFINHVINPVLYGFLDPNCRKVLKDMRNRRKLVFPVPVE